MSNLSCGTHVAEPSANKDCRKLLNQFCRFLPKLKLPISADAKLPLTHAGVWIETSILMKSGIDLKVTPHAGVWIETFELSLYDKILSSLPTRVKSNS